MPLEDFEFLIRLVYCITEKTSPPAYLCGKKTECRVACSCENGKWRFGREALIMLFPLKDTPLLAAGYLIITGELVSFGKFLVLDL